MVQTTLHGKSDRDKTKHGIHIDFTKDDEISSYWINKNNVNRTHPFTPFQVKLLSALTTRYKQSVHRLACQVADDAREQTKLRLAGTEDQKSAAMRKAVKKAYADNLKRMTNHPPAINMRFKGARALMTTFGVSPRDVAKVKATLSESLEINETVTWHVPGQGDGLVCLAPIEHYSAGDKHEVTVRLSQQWIGLISTYSVQVGAPLPVNGTSQKLFLVLMAYTDVDEQSYNVPKQWFADELFDYLGIKNDKRRTMYLDRITASVNALLDKATPIETKRYGYTYLHGINFDPQVSDKGLIYFRQIWTRLKVL